MQAFDWTSFAVSRDATHLHSSHFLDKSLNSTSVCLDQWSQLSTSQLPRSTLSDRVAYWLTRSEAKALIIQWHFLNTLSDIIMFRLFKKKRKKGILSVSTQKRCLKRTECGFSTVGFRRCIRLLQILIFLTSKRNHWARHVLGWMETTLHQRRRQFEDLLFP